MESHDAKMGHAEENGIAEPKKRHKKVSRDDGDQQETMGDGAIARLAEKISPEKIVEVARDLPNIIQKEIQKNPYRTVGIAAGVGFGVGAVVGSRLLRMALLATGGYLASEVARGRMKKVIDELVSQLDDEEEPEPAGK
jgi:ElaB/YqjD/DUF883 family membrane-anchored ribosome-binding protein